MEDENTTRQSNVERNNPRLVFPLMIIMGILGILSWIGMFSLGLLLNSQPYRDVILNHFDLINFFMSILTYTPTNIAMLSVIAAFSGGCASRLLVAGMDKKEVSDTRNPQIDKTDSHFYMKENPFSSMLRGLVVYFAFLTGVFIASPNPFGTTTPQQYAQTAGVVSLLSFIMGYDPTAFRSFISLSNKFKKKQ
jgi:hypothetical protein